MTGGKSSGVAATSLPRSFRQIRLALAREKGHPEGRLDYGYRIVAPLNAESRIDPEVWRAHRDACRVVRFRPNEDDDVGHLVHKPGGTWAFRYDIRGDEDDEVGFRFQDERFEIGEYVSIREDDGELHTFKVVSVQPL